MTELREQLRRNLAHVRGRIDEACRRCGRAGNSVTLVAVTKYALLEWVQELVTLGQRDLGEARPQQLEERSELIQAEIPIRWHLIGHLQRNKIRKIIGATLIHSVDSWKLLDAIDRVAVETGVRQSVLLEVNLTGEVTKNGFTEKDIREGWQQASLLKSVDVRGLMTMARESSSSEDTRPTFAQLRQLRDDLQELGPWELPELSMGMTGDFEVAIEEGATLVRIGSALFAELETLG